MSLLIPHRGTVPQLGADVFVAPNATIIGDVQIGDESSVWFQSVIRGDVYPIRIGRRVNIQDLSMIHVTAGQFETHVEDEVTIGHAVTIHGCVLRRRCLIGIRSVVLDGAEIGEESIIGAGSVVTPGVKIPPRSLALGAPCRVVRELRADEIEFLGHSAAHYVDLAATYRG